MTAQGAGGIIKVVPDAALGAGFLGKLAGLVLLGNKGALRVHIGSIELQLAALAAAEDLHLQSAGDQVGPVPQNPAGLTQL